MHRTFARPALALIVSFACAGSVSAQSLERIQMHYPQQIPEVLLSGTSPVYWEPVLASASVEGQTISVRVFPPDIGFSVVTPWSVSVPLPVLPGTGNYDIHVSLDYGDGSSLLPIGFMRALVFESRPQGRIFAASFE